MRTRKAKITDAGRIHSLVTSYAEQSKMLFRSMADIYENLQTFIVAELDGEVVGCCCLNVIWADLAEIKSLAVAAEHKGKGIGTSLVNTALKQAGELGLPKVFALTLEPDFFKKMEFGNIPKKQLPMKVWKDCAKCPKQQNCDEVAVIKILKPKD